ncbi:hypothetical protein HMPREF9440_02004, partial [Sutterella parvirubra YIT 11816]
KVGHRRARHFKTPDLERVRGFCFLGFNVASLIPQRSRIV